MERRLFYMLIAPDLILPVNSKCFAHYPVKLL